MTEEKFNFPLQGKRIDDDVERKQSGNRDKKVAQNFVTNLDVNYDEMYRKLKVDARQANQSKMKSSYVSQFIAIDQ